MPREQGLSEEMFAAQFDTEYDRANVPPYNGNDPPPAPGSLKRSLFPTLLNEVQNKGTQGVRARYGAELLPIISIVRYPGRPVISVPEKCLPLNCRAVTLTAGAILKEEKKASLVRERHFERQFWRG